MFFYNSTLFAGQFGYGVYTSQDSGDTWIQKNNGLTITTSSGYKYFTVIGNMVFVGTEKNIYVTTDKGNHWKKVNTDFPSDIIINSITSNSNTLFAGTSNEVWKCNVNDLSIGIESQYDNLFEQLIVYPNPSNGKINISTNNLLIKKVELFNLLGESMKLENVNIPQPDICSFNLKCNTGIYLLKVQTDKGNIVKRIEIR